MFQPLDEDTDDTFGPSAEDLEGIEGDDDLGLDFEPEE